MAVSINETVLDDLLKNYQTPEEIIGENGLLIRLFFFPTIILDTKKKSINLLVCYIGIVTIFGTIIN